MLISLGLGRYIENIAYFEQIGGRMYFVDKGISSDPTGLVVNSLLLILRFWIARQMNSNQTIFLVLLRIRLAFRLRPSCAVIWGTCIALTEK